MAYLNQISHPDPLTQQKVNFFADYFNLATNLMGRDKDFEVENILSLLDKIIFQIETNISHCAKYINVYLEHPLLNSTYTKAIPFFKKISPYFIKYQSQGKDSKKIDWLRTNSEFLTLLKKSRHNLKRNLLRSSLRVIIRYLRCSHSLEIHQEDIIYHTNTMVSEFYLNGWSNSDIRDFFSKILSNYISEFPFPKSFFKKNKNEKKLFFEKKTFTQQFEGLLNLYEKTKSKSFFIFKIKNIKSNTDFYFKYNKVAFYNPNHIKLKQLISLYQSNFTTDFFSEENTIFAVISIKYHSVEIARDEAIKNILLELSYINEVCDSSAFLEIFSFITTSNFKSFMEHRSGKTYGHLITEYDLVELNDNPYLFLKKAPKPYKDHILKFEPLFIKAINSKNISDYWIYLEAICNVGNFKNKLIPNLSNILLLNSNTYFKRRLTGEVINYIIWPEYPEDFIGISIERQRYYHEQIRNETINHDELIEELNHPLINYIKTIYKRDLSVKNYNAMKKYFIMVLSEAYAQRNAILHKGEEYEKSIISLRLTLPNLIKYFRWTVFASKSKSEIVSFEQVLDVLNLEGQKLLSNK